MNTNALDAYCKRAARLGYVVLYVPSKPATTGHPNTVQGTFSFMDPPTGAKP